MKLAVLRTNVSLLGGYGDVAYRELRCEDFF